MASARLVLLSYALPAPAMVDGSSVPAVGAWAVDASVNEQHVTTAQVSSHQVESGQDVTSYIRPMPRKLTLEAFVTNTPLAIPIILRNGTAATISGLDRGTPQSQQVTIAGKSINFTAQSFGQEFDRVADFYGGIMSAALAGAVWGIYTTLHTYSKMAIVNFAVPRSVNAGNSLQGAIDFQEIRIVSTQTVSIQARTKTKRGPKVPIDADKEKNGAAKKSTLKAIITSAFGP